MDEIKRLKESQRQHETFNKIMQLRPAETMSLNDRGFSSVFAQLYNGVLRFNATSKSWVYYDGVIWRPDVGGTQAALWARDFSELLLVYGNRIENEGNRKTFCQAALKYGSLKYRETLIRDAAPLMAITQDSFDKDGYLLNCRDCTIDLRTLRGRPHSADDLLTHVCGCNFQPYADHEAWNNFLRQIMQGKAEKISYLQRMCGYSLSASNQLECAFILYGPSARNGKSTFLETIGKTLGSYAAVTNPETLAATKHKSGAAASPDLARLQGIRFLHVPELPKQMLLDSALFKRLTGNDTITARKLYAQPFEYTPAFTMWLSTNNLPVISDDTLFRGDRLRIIVFDRHFSTAERDAGLKAKLCEQDVKESVLWWMIEGLQSFYEHGERPPECVLAATNAFRNDSDKTLKFFDECLTESEKNTSAAAAYEAYALWCASNGFGCERKGSFYESLRTHGLMQPTGTVDGKTLKNVICGYELIENVQM